MISEVGGNTVLGLTRHRKARSARQIKQQCPQFHENTDAYEQRTNHRWIRNSFHNLNFKMVWLQHRLPLLCEIKSCKSSGEKDQRSLYYQRDLVSFSHWAQGRLVSRLSHWFHTLPCASVDTAGNHLYITISEVQLLTSLVSLSPACLSGIAQTSDSDSSKVP